jgi:diguanylate cyclase (GGDEF)-like protein
MAHPRLLSPRQHRIWHWLPVATGPLVALLACLAIFAVRDQERGATAAQVQFTDLEATIYRMEELEWRAHVERELAPGLVAELGHLDARARAAFRVLDRVHAHDSDAAVVGGDLRRFRALLGVQLELLGTRSSRQTTAYYAARADTAFRKLDDTLDRVQAEEHEEATAARRQADTWTGMSLGIAGLLLALLAWRFDVARRRSALARERELESLAAVRERDARHDPLTGLPNRRHLLAALASSVAGADHGAVLLLDLDGFKELNDALGHGAGDELLRQAGQRFAAEVPPPAIVARLGGDEFAALIPDAGPDEGVAAAERVLAALEEPFLVEDLPLHLEGSIGVAAFPHDGASAGALVRHADVAMYQAKNGRTRVERYDPSRDRHSRDRLALIGDLRRAIERDELVLHFQPQLDLRTGVVEGVEALVRWEHPERGLVPPGAFLPLAEQTSLMRPLTLWVLDRALADVADWEDGGVPLSVAVNLAAPNLLDREVARDIAAALARTGVAPERLTLEITEGVIMAESGRAEEALASVSALGVRISLDDFGTGHSSLARLKRLRVHELKIDRSFILGMDTHRADRAIVRSTIDLARSLELRVVGEGVEHDAAAQDLRAYGCDLAQGFGLCRPLPAAELARWLAERRAAPAFKAAVRA